MDMRLEGLFKSQKWAREEEKVKELADDFMTQVIGMIHSELVAEVEEEGKMVMECFLCSDGGRI